MIEKYSEPREPLEPESDPDAESLALRSQEDWQAEVNRLERERDEVMRASGLPVELLLHDRDFNFLLGKIQVAHEQLAAHAIDEELDQARQDFTQ